MILAVLLAALVAPTATHADTVALGAPIHDNEVLGSIRGQVVGPANAPIGGVEVTAWARERRIVAWTTTAPDGSFVLTGLPAGRYRMDVRDPNGRTQGMTRSNRYLTLGEGLTIKGLLLRAITAADSVQRSSAWGRAASSRGPLECSWEPDIPGRLIYTRNLDGSVPPVSAVDCRDPADPSTQPRTDKGGCAAAYTRADGVVAGDGCVALTRMDLVVIARVTAATWEQWNPEPPACSNPALANCPTSLMSPTVYHSYNGGCTHECAHVEEYEHEMKVLYTNYVARVNGIDASDCQKRKAEETDAWNDMLRRFEEYENAEQAREQHAYSRECDYYKGICLR